MSQAINFMRVICRKHGLENLLKLPSKIKQKLARERCQSIEKNPSDYFRHHDFLIIKFAETNAVSFCSEVKLLLLSV